MSSANIKLSLADCTRRRIQLIIEKCRRLNVEGVLNRYHVGCRTAAGDALIIQDAVTKELGIPVLSLRRDDFDPRVYSEEQHKSELKSFKDILTSNRQPRQSIDK
jgi:benzoyl-CoA reductase/2-hydroxyglutaryl-CoA dehydratase subunit BcrC/BadD/HgdB